MATRIEHIRGPLAPQEPGARGLERVSRNPSCQRLRALTMASITPSFAVTNIYGGESREGQSPFAIGAGNRFEKRLFQNGAAELFALYTRGGKLAIGENRVVDVSEAIPGKSPRDMAARLDLSERLLQMKLAADPAAPNLIIKPRLAICLVGVEHHIEPDFLVAASGDAFYRPGEVKSYPDRDGKTDPSDIRSACRQAAVAVVGLRQQLTRFGVADCERRVAERADLVLRAPGSFQPTLRPMTLRGEVYSIERTIMEAPRDLDELERLLASIAPDANLSMPAVVDAIPNHYVDDCREHCALAERCKRQSIACSDPGLLGNYAREELAPAGSIERTLELLNGRGNPPMNQQEIEIQARLREAMQEYQLAVNHGA